MNTNKGRASALFFYFFNGTQASVSYTPMWVDPGAADLHVLVKCRDGWVAEMKQQLSLS